METNGKNDSKDNQLWEVLTIVFIWLVVLSFLYIVFQKAKLN